MRFENNSISRWDIPHHKASQRKRGKRTEKVYPRVYSEESPLGEKANPKRRVYWFLITINIYWVLGQKPDKGLRALKPWSACNDLAASARSCSVHGAVNISLEEAANAGNLQKAMQSTQWQPLLFGLACHWPTMARTECV